MHNSTPLAILGILAFIMLFAFGVCDMAQCQYLTDLHKTGHFPASQETSYQRLCHP